MIYFLQLDDRLRESGNANTGQNEATRSDHCDNTEVGRAQQTRQHERADHLGRER